MLEFGLGVEDPLLGLLDRALDLRAGIHLALGLRAGVVPKDPLLRLGVPQRLAVHHLVAGGVGAHRQRLTLGVAGRGVHRLAVLHGVGGIDGLLLGGVLRGGLLEPGEGALREPGLFAVLIGDIDLQHPVGVVVGGAGELVGHRLLLALEDGLHGRAQGDTVVEVLSLLHGGVLGRGVGILLRAGLRGEVDAPLGGEVLLGDGGLPLRRLDDVVALVVAGRHQLLGVRISYHGELALDGSLGGSHRHGHIPGDVLVELLAGLLGLCLHPGVVLLGLPGEDHGVEVAVQGDGGGGHLAGLGEDCGAVVCTHGHLPGLVGVEDIAGAPVGEGHPRDGAPALLVSLPEVTVCVRQFHEGGVALALDPLLLVAVVDAHLHRLHCVVGEGVVCLESGAPLLQLVHDGDERLADLLRGVHPPEVERVLDLLGGEAVSLQALGQVVPGIGIGLARIGVLGGAHRAADDRHR